jgi:hypothetical protein
MASGESVNTPPGHRIAGVVTKIALVVCALLAFIIFAGSYLSKKDIDERPLQVGEAVSVKNASKGWRPGYVRSISEQGEYVIAMGATPELAARPQTDILRLQGSGRLKRRKDDSS